MKMRFSVVDLKHNLNFWDVRRCLFYLFYFLGVWRVRLLLLFFYFLYMSTFLCPAETFLPPVTQSQASSPWPTLVPVQLWTYSSPSLGVADTQRPTQMCQIGFRRHQPNYTCEALAWTWATVFTLDPNLPPSLLPCSHRGDWNELMLLVQLRPKLCQLPQQRDLGSEPNVQLHLILTGGEQRWTTLTL